MTLIHGPTLVLPSGPTCGAVEVVDGVITAVHKGSHVEQLACFDKDVVRLDGGYLVPSYIDVHCHGGAGADFGTGDAPQLAAAAEFHAKHGTGRMLASLVTAPIDELTAQLATIAALIDSGTTNIVGVHLEGPFLSSARCGAQNPAFLTNPDPAVFLELVQSGRGALKMMTLAPELPGAEDVIRAAVAARVIVAVGHTDGTYDDAATAFRRGATVATHLFNGMRPVHHREPGTVLAALDAGAACEVINDGVHLHPSMIRLVAGHDPDQLVFITDSVSASGVGDGSFSLGGQDVTVNGGQARLNRTGTLAGSTLTMDEAVRRGVFACGLPIEVAVRAATANPARLLGIGDVAGSIAVGRRADLLHLDDELKIVGRIRAGVRVN